MAGHFQFVIVSGLHDRVHFFERHAQGVVVVGVGRGGIPCGIRLDPFHAVLHQFANCRASFVGATDQQNQPFHADFAELGVPVHQPTRSANFSTAGCQTRSGDQIILDGFFQPDVDVKQAAAAASRRVAALQSELRVAGRENRDVLNRVLDVEIFQRGDVEIRRMKMSFDQPRHDRPTVGVDHFRFRLRRNFGSLLRRAGIGDEPLLDHQQPVRNRSRPRSINKLPVSNHCLPGCCFHAASLTDV